MFTQLEQVLEDKLVVQLLGIGYAKAPVTDEASILANLKAQLEGFNSVTLISQVLNHLTKSAGVFEKAKILRGRMKLHREDGTTAYLSFFDSRE